jgi:hypothetical protein
MALRCKLGSSLRVSTCDLASFQTGLAIDDPLLRHQLSENAIDLTGAGDARQLTGSSARPQPADHHASEPPYAAALYGSSSLSLPISPRNFSSVVQTRLSSIIFNNVIASFLERLSRLLESILQHLGIADKLHFENLS